MAISEHASGSQALTVTTEHTLTANPETTDGVFQLFVDVNALVAGDILELRIKEKARSGDTQRTALLATLVGAQSADDALWVSPSLILLHGWDISAKQTTGTTRTILWSIRKAA